MQTQLAYGQIRFRPLEPEDLELLYLWENDSEIWKVSGTLVPLSRYALKKYIEESHRDLYEVKQLRLIIEDRTGNPVGTIDLFDFEPYHQRAGVGILIYAASDRRKGLASDALALMCRYAGETLGLYLLYANIGSDNAGSIALFEKSGFRAVGVKKNWNRTLQGRVDEILYQKFL